MDVIEMLLQIALWHFWIILLKRPHSLALLPKVAPTDDTVFYKEFDYKQISLYNHLY